MIDLIVKKEPKSPAAEAYRTLRTNIQFASFDKELQAILITSSGPSEGKSTTTSNLALAIAQTGKRVIVLDCDLRKPSIHKKFRISNTIGLSDLLVNGLNVMGVANQFEDNLFVLTAGTIPPNPSEMLASKRMRGFIEELRKTFDYIILDTPPVNAVTDAQILSTMADGVILVVSSGEAEKGAAERARDLLTNVKANIIGVVLNKLDIKSRSGYSYYYYGDHSQEKRRIRLKEKRNKK